jgi:hypothetical protein
MGTAQMGSTVYCYREIPATKGSNYKFELTAKHLPECLKESYNDFLKEKNAKYVTEKEYSEWLTKQK